MFETKFTKIVDQYPKGFERLDSGEDMEESEEEMFTKFQQMLLTRGFFIASLEDGPPQLKEFFENVNLKNRFCFEILSKFKKKNKGRYGLSRKSFLEMVRKRFLNKLEETNDANLKAYICVQNEAYVTGRGAAQNDSTFFVGFSWDDAGSAMDMQEIEFSTKRVAPVM